ncbi:MAG: hypothetical protein AAF321_05670 [Pseudomonadota bacterium]
MPHPTDAMTGVVRQRPLRALLTGLVVLAGAMLAAPAEAAKLGGSDLFWTFDGDYAGTCVRVNEPADGAHWDDNGLCGSMLPAGIRWSHQGPVAGLRCVAINEPVDRSTWDDNYLCVPRSAPIHFVFSPSGAPNLTRPAACVPLQEPADPDTWDDNVLCAITLDEFERSLLAASVVDEAPLRARIRDLEGRIGDASAQMRQARQAYDQAREQLQRADARIAQLQAELASERARREELERRPTVIIDDPRVIRSPNETGVVQPGATDGPRGLIVPNVR